MNVQYNLIAATARNGVIGNGNTIPWRLPPDLKRFKEITMGCPTIMGRKTYQSMGKALPGRPAIVLTRDEDFTIPDGTVVHSLEEAFTVVEGLEFEKAFIIGGEQIYRQAMNYASLLYLTVVDKVIEGDAYFPYIHFGKFEHKGWNIVGEVETNTHVNDDLGSFNYHYYLLNHQAEDWRSNIPLDKPCDVMA